MDGFGRHRHSITNIHIQYDVGACTHIYAHVLMLYTFVCVHAHVKSLIVYSGSFVTWATLARSSGNTRRKLLHMMRQHIMWHTHMLAA